ncbi:hypothetical protein [Nostoc sp. TCL26-01]|nr:hypothetical protein [Nostoc sp. TCL26-01]
MKLYDLYPYKDVALEVASIANSNLTYLTATSTKISKSIKTVLTHLV